MDLTGFKDAIEVTDTDSDAQIQTILDLVADTLDLTEANYDLKHFCGTACFLSSLNPELMNEVKSCTFGDMKISLKEGQDWCKVYNMFKRQSEGFAAGSGARSGLSKKGL